MYLREALAELLERLRTAVVFCIQDTSHTGACGCDGRRRVQVREKETTLWGGGITDDWLSRSIEGNGTESARGVQGCRGNAAAQEGRGHQSHRRHAAFAHDGPVRARAIMGTYIA